MNLRRRPLIAGAMALMAAHGNVFPQPNSGKVWRVGFLSESWPRVPLSTYTLRSTGYVEGRDFVFDYKYAQGHRNRLPILAAELVANKPDVLLGMLNPEIAALKAATSTVPIVMLYATGPVEMGFVASLARPGGNITGTTTSVPEMAGKMVQVLRDTVPAMKHLTWLHDLAYPGINQYARSIEDAVARYGLILREKDVRTRADLDLAIASLERERPDAMGVFMVGVSGEQYAGWRQLPWPVDDNYLGRFDSIAGQALEAGYGAPIELQRRLTFCPAKRLRTTKCRSTNNTASNSARSLPRPRAA